AVGRGQRAAVLPSRSVHDAAPIDPRTRRRSDRLARGVRRAACIRSRRARRVPEDAASAAAGDDGSDRRRAVPPSRLAAGSHDDDNGRFRIGATTMSALAMVLLMAQLAAPAVEAQPPVEIVLFSDFQCPFCAQLAAPIRELQTAADGTGLT